MFSITLKTLLDADKRVYVVNFTQTLIVICNVIFAQISVWVYPSIHILKLISGILFILQPVIFGYIVKRDYRIDWSTDPEYSLNKIEMEWICNQSSSVYSWQHGHHHLDHSYEP